MEGLRSLMVVVVVMMFSYYSPFPCNVACGCTVVALKQAARNNIVSMETSTRMVGATAFIELQQTDTSLVGWSAIHMASLPVVEWFCVYCATPRSRSDRNRGVVPGSKMHLRGRANSTWAVNPPRPPTPPYPCLLYTSPSPRD